MSPINLSSILKSETFISRLKFKVGRSPTDTLRPGQRKDPRVERVDS